MKIYFIPAIVLSVISFVVFRSLYLKTSSGLIRVILVLTAAALSTPAVWFTSNYALCIPYADWFFDFHTISGIEATSGLVGSMLGVMFASSKMRPNKLNGYILAVCSIMSAIILTAPFAKQLYYWPECIALEDKWEDGVCLQTSGYTCVPACAATLIRMQSGKVTEKELAIEAGSTPRGTEVWYLARALRKRGYEHKFKTLESVKDAPIPSILCVILTGVPHVVVLLEKDEQGVVIGEPMSGKKKYSWKVFQRCYHPSNSCITIHKVKPSP